MDHVATNKTLIPISPSVYSCLFCLALSGVCIAASQPYQSVIALDTLKIDSTVYSGIVILSSALSAIIAVFMGHISDVFLGRKKLLVFTATLSALGFFLTFCLLSPSTFAFCMILILPIVSTISQQLYALLRSISDVAGAKSNFLTGVGRSLFAASWVVSAPAAGFVAIYFDDVSTTFALSAAACILVALIIGCNRSLDHLANSKQNLVRPKVFKQLQENWLPIASCSLLRAALRMNALCLGPLIVALRGDLADIGFVAGLVALLEVPCIIFWGWLGKNWSEKTILAIGGLISVAYFVVCSVADSPEQIYWASPLAAVGGAAIFSASIPFFQNLVPNQVGLATSFGTLSSFAGSCIASLIFAAAFNMLGVQTSMLIGAVLMSAGAAALHFKTPHRF